jgi:hypothetical protein
VTRELAARHLPVVVVFVVVVFAIIGAVCGFRVPILRDFRRNFKPAT